MEISILIIRRAGQITFFKHVEIFDVLLIVEQFRLCWNIQSTLTLVHYYPKASCNPATQTLLEH